jgi:hypothetical protein
MATLHKTMEMRLIIVDFRKSPVETSQHRAGLL